MVGYYNTLPFLYGLQDNSLFNLILDIPSKCMDYYSEGAADIALVPIASLLDRSDYKIITDYCIGCNGSVRTVSLFSNDDLQTVNKIYLDEDSRTSQKLVKILCERFWKIEPIFEEINVRNIRPEILKSNEAVLMIGDKVFEMEESFKYNYDLGVEWKKFTNLPFAFAVWISRKQTHPEIIKELNNALSIGVENISLVLQKHSSLAMKIKLSEYFSQFIDYHLDKDKKEALEIFFSFNQKAIPITE
jgi:chorismate dehydratase